MAPKNSTTLTARDNELLTLAFHCLREKPNIDYDLLAAKAELKGAKSASDSFGRLCNKILAGSKKDSNDNGGAENADGAGASPKKVTTPKKRKTGKGDEGEDASPSKKKTTPGKKGRGQKAKKSVASAAADDESEGEEAVAVKSEVVEQDD